MAHDEISEDVIRRPQNGGGACGMLGHYTTA